MNWSQQSAHFPGSQLEACCFHDRKLSFWKAALPPCLLSLHSSLRGAALGPPTSPKVRLASTEMPGRCLHGPNANSLCVEVMCIWITSACTWLWKYAALSSSPEPTTWAQGLKDDLFPSQYLAVYFCPPSFHAVALSLGRYLLHCSFPASLSFQTRGLLPPPFSLVTTFHRDGETQAYGIVWRPRTNYENIHDCPDSVNQPVWRHTGPTWDLTLTWARCPLFQLTLGALQHPIWLFKDFQCLHWRDTSTWAGSQSVVTVLTNTSFWKGEGRWRWLHCSKTASAKRWAQHKQGWELVRCYALLRGEENGTSICDVSTKFSSSPSQTSTTTSDKPPFNEMTRSGSSQLLRLLKARITWEAAIDKSILRNHGNKM